MTYAGEHTSAGNLGHLFVILSFVLAAMSGFAYLIAANNQDKRQQWIRYARFLFFGHVAASLAFMGMIFFLLLNHYYEFQYIYEQSSEDMTFRYLLVCFWGGQEGSFMLWIFWHLVLGSILIFTSKKYEPYVMSVFCLVQVFLLSMLLGVYIGDLKIGSSPFALRRQVNETFGHLWNLIPDYFTFDNNLQTGRGLNPLLRNYWMTIHPPTLFLGFALTLVPFCYAVAGIWTKQLKEWIKPALPWTFLGIMVLGGGILMGGRWAYESLSFGGFWAWDPVENASFVPWIFLLGAGHLMLINRNNTNSLFSTFLFTFFAFVLVVLSTFLTRSGILGETSVHSFTGEDMMGQLLLYLMFFVWLSVHLLLFDKKLKWVFGAFSILVTVLAIFTPTDALSFSMGEATITIKSMLTSMGLLAMVIFLIIGYAQHFPKTYVTAEESFSAREFWMFIASILLLMSAFHIIFNTSLPAINYVFGTKGVISQDERNAFYNFYQVPFAIAITFIMAFTQFLKYKKTDPQRFFKQILVSAGISLILSGLLIKEFSFQQHLSHAILAFTATFAVIANLDYYLRLMKGRLNHFGASIAHVGFGLVMLGSLISQANQKIISKNYKGYQLEMMGKDSQLKSEEDVQLFKGELTSMGDYFVVFRNKRFEEKDAHLYYDIDYLEQLPLEYKKGDRVRFNFQLYECNTTHPAANDFAQEVNFWKPIDARDPQEFYSYPTWESHRPGKLLFTLSPFVQLNNRMGNTAEPGTMQFWSHDVFTHIKQADVSPLSTGKMPGFTINGKLGDTLWTAGYRIVVEDVYKTRDSATSTMGAMLSLRVLSLLDMQGKYPMFARPEFKIDSAGHVISPVAEIKPLGLEFRLTNIDLTQTDSNAVHQPTEALNQPHAHEAVESTVDTATVVNPSAKHDTQDKQARFEIEFVTPEYIVMHAKIFPYIIVLWWGCAIMCLGTLMAVIHRVIQNKRAKN